MQPFALITNYIITVYWFSLSLRLSYLSRPGCPGHWQSSRAGGGSGQPQRSGPSHLQPRLPYWHLRVAKATARWAPERFGGTAGSARLATTPQLTRGLVVGTLATWRQPECSTLHNGTTGPGLKDVFRVYCVPWPPDRPPYPECSGAAAQSASASGRVYLL